jgi:hypothetical protein
MVAKPEVRAISDYIHDGGPQGGQLSRYGDPGDLESLSPVVFGSQIT